MGLRKYRYVFLLMIIFTLLLPACSMLEIDKDKSGGKLPTTKGLNKFIEKNKINNIVFTEDLYNKYTLLIYEDGPRKYGYYTTTSYYGRVVTLASSESESYSDIPDFEVEYRVSTPEFLLIRINESCLSDVDKIVIRYFDSKRNNKIEEIIITSISKYNIITNSNNEQIITNIIDIEAYDQDNNVIFRNSSQPRGINNKTHKNGK